MKLIPEWRSAWRFLSVQIAALVAILAALYDYVPQLQAWLPPGWMKWAGLVVILARVIHQPKLHQDNTP